ncbi:hypothetical protein JB92DRAFT_3211254 [Gautieria morchelliformis]|nr:hypothetical protein JB92DRAFT_3211254 [Gautieria morchelliformis]
MNNTNLPSLSDLWLDYNDDLALAAADCRRLTLPPLRPWSRPATPPPPIPAPLPRLPGPRMATVNPPPIADTVPARGGHRRGASKAKAKIKAKSGKAKGRAARGDSSPRNQEHDTSLDPELNLSSKAGRTSTPLVGRDHGEQRRGRGGRAGRRARGKLVVHQYEFVRQPDGEAYYKCIHAAYHWFRYFSCYRVSLMIGGSVSPAGKDVREIFDSSSAHPFIILSTSSTLSCHIILGTMFCPSMTSATIVKHYQDEKLSTTTSNEPHGRYLTSQSRARYLLFVLENVTKLCSEVGRGAHLCDHAASPCRLDATVRSFKALLRPRIHNPTRHGSNMKEAYSAVARKINISSGDRAAASKELVNRSRVTMLDLIQEGPKRQGGPCLQCPTRLRGSRNEADPSESAR